MLVSINTEKLKAIQNEKAKAARAEAFKNEYDPLVGKHLRGEVTQEDLVALAEDIRNRFPYQE
jgi:hypothetical protein